MNKLNKKIASIALVSLMVTSSVPTVAFASKNLNVEEQNVGNQCEVLFAAEEISDRDALQYRIDNHINDLDIEGLRTETSERIVDNGNVKMIDSAPTIQKVETVKLADGSIEETYVVISLGEMQVKATANTPGTMPGSLFTSAVDYITKVYFRKAYFTSAAGYDCYQPQGGEIEITATRNNFTVTRIEVTTGGNGFAYDVNGTPVLGVNYSDSGYKTGTNVSSIYKAINCPYYFEANAVAISGIGTTGIITAKHGSSTYSGAVDAAKVGAFGTV